MKIWIGLAAIMCLAIGCSGSPGTGENRDKADFPDVPSPADMKYESGHGHVSPSGHLRVYTQVYTGTRGVADLANFYSSALPMHQWVPAKNEGTDPVKMVFEKKAERIEIEIVGGMTTKITINFGAKS